MAYLKRSMLAAALATALLALGAAEAQTTKEMYRFKGLSAWASFSTSDECSSTGAFVSAFEDVSRSGGSPRTTNSGVYASYSSYNWCTGEGFFWSGFTDDAVVTGSTAHVSVAATVPLMNYETGEVVPLEVDLEFRATRDITSRGVSHYTYTTEFERSRFRWQGRSNSAAVSGSLLLGGGDLLDFLPTSDAFISVSNFGSQTIERH